MLFLALLIQLVAAEFYLQVWTDGNPPFNVSKYQESTNEYVLYGGVNDWPTGEPVVFNYDGELGLYENGGLFVLIQDISYEKNDTLVLTNSTGYPWFSIWGDLLYHAGNSTFYLCNGYPHNKYLNFLQTDPNCFLGEPVELHVAYL